MSDSAWQPYAAAQVTSGSVTPIICMTFYYVAN
jgi:hypothetical protein